MRKYISEYSNGHALWPAVIPPLILVTVLLAGGCVNKDIHADEIRYVYDWWMTPLLLVIGLAMVVGGRRLTRMKLPKYLEQLPWPTMILGVCLLGAAPTPAMYSLRLDPAGFEVKYGLWFLPSHDEVAFADLAAMRFETETAPGTKSNGTRTVMICTRTSGSTYRLPVGNLVHEALPEIKAFAGEAGVQVTDLR